jgi:hypothetical protein
MSCFAECEFELFSEAGCWSVGCWAGLLQADGVINAKSIPTKKVEMESLVFMRCGIREGRDELADGG